MCLCFQWPAPAEYDSRCRQGRHRHDQVNWKKLSPMSTSTLTPAFLDNLSDDARYLSCKPAWPHWSPFVKGEDASSSLHSSSSLCSIARACFTGIFFEHCFSVVDASCAGTVRLNGKRPFGLALVDWIRAAGSSLTELYVDRDLEESLLALGDTVYQETLSLLKDNCPALRRL